MDDEITIEVVNLTGHTVGLGPTAEKVAEFYSKGQVRIEPHYEQIIRARLLDDGKDTGVVVPVLCAVNGRPVSVPEPKPNTLYVVSGMVESQLTDFGRLDFVCSARVSRRKDRTVGFARALLTHTEVETWRQRFISNSDT